MVLKQLSRVVVQFSPWSRDGKSAREFLSRIQAVKAQASNPDCKIVPRMRVEGADPPPPPPRAQPSASSDMNTVIA